MYKTTLIILLVCPLWMGCKVFQPSSYTGRVNHMYRLKQFVSDGNNSDTNLKSNTDDYPGTLWAGVFDSSHRLAIVQGKSGNLRIISENPPDTATKTLTEISATGAYKGADANLRVMLARDVVQLGQRTVAVNLLRDALWRITDGSVNDSNTSAFLAILEAAKAVALAETKASQKTQNLIEVVVQPNDDGSITLPIAEAKIINETLTVEEKGTSARFGRPESVALRWTARIPQSGNYDVDMCYSIDGSGKDVSVNMMMNKKELTKTPVAKGKSISTKTIWSDVQIDDGPTQIVFSAQPGSSGSMLNLHYVTIRPKVAHQ